MLIAPILAAALQSPCPVTNGPSTGHPMKMPAQDIDNTFVVAPRTVDGRALRFYTDSGGATLVFAGIAGDAHFAVSGSGEHQQAMLPPLACDAFVPNPHAPGFRLAPDAMKAKMPIPEPDLAGILGAFWFDGRTWTWDYPGGTLYWRAGGDVPRVDGAHVAQLGFQKENGVHSAGFPRISATIDGKQYDFLLDTGAVSRFTAAAATQLHASDGPHGSSFITATIAAALHRAHPDWPYIARGEAGTNADMIRIANVRIGGYDSGPAWFAIRPDKNFTEFMSQFMDRTVFGSIGGAVLHSFRLTVDYAGEKAYFEKP